MCRNMAHNLPDGIRKRLLFINLMRADVEICDRMISIKRKKYSIFPINRVRPIIFKFTAKFMSAQ